MIVSTGINHMDVAQNGQETATKSLQRRESQMLIVEAGMKFNTVTGFTRLALLLKDLIRLHYKSYPINSTETAPRKVRLKDMKFVRNKKTGKLGSEKTSGFTYFDILPEDLEDDLDLVLELGNVAMSKSLEMDLQLLGIDRLLSLPPTMTPEGQQKPVYKPEELAKFIQSKFSLPQEILDDEEDATNNLEKEAKDGLLYKQDDPKDFIKGAEMAQMGQPVPTMPDAMGGRFPAGAIGGGNPAVGNTVGTP